MADATINISDLEAAAVRCDGYIKQGIWARWIITPRSIRLRAQKEGEEITLDLTWTALVSMRHPAGALEQLERTALRKLGVIET